MLRNKQRRTDASKFQKHNVSVKKHKSVSALRKKAVVNNKKNVRYMTTEADLAPHFLDKVRIQVQGGDGGDGCASYARTLSGHGAPNGGNGGNGGDVYLVTDPGLSTFSFTSYHFKASRGSSGGSDNLNGSRGEDLEIPIPVGTILRHVVGKDPLTGQVKTKFLADLSQPGLRVRLARGAPGGFGNRTFKANDRPKAGFTTVGETVMPQRFELELKLIADCALVGFPNAGKSSLLRAVSSAEPKVASYPFTTLAPTIGAVDFAQIPTLASEDAAKQKNFTIADLPGLVDGAHMNVGLGHEFLRHIERTKLLIYVIDTARPVKHMKTIQELQSAHLKEMEMRKAELHQRKLDEDKRLKEVIENRRTKMLSVLKSRGIPEEDYDRYDYHDFFPKDHELEQLLTHGGTRRIYQQEFVERPRNIHVTDLGDPVAEFLALRRELALYQPELAARPSIVFANKADKHVIAHQNQLARLREVVPSHWPIFTGSAKEREGLEPMLQTIGYMLQFINMEPCDDTKP